MANTKENLIKMAKDKNRKSGRKKGSLNKATLIKKQVETDLREGMLNKIKPEWFALIEKTIEKAKGGEDTTADLRALTFLINQGAGRATERKEEDASVEKLDALSTDIRSILEERVCPKCGAKELEAN